MSPLSSFDDHLSAPRGRGRLTPGDAGVHSGAAGGAPCGDLVRLDLRVRGDSVAEAGFEARGCGAAIAAGSAAVELVSGRPVLEAARIDLDGIAQELGGLSPAKRHAAVLAADALHRALGAAAGSGAVQLAARPDRTLVAMSGGVDSAVAAHLVAAEGHDVVAVTLELWADAAGDGTQSCCSPEAVTGARALAHAMGFPHFTLDLRASFRARVVEDFVSERAAGRTPNPCVRCNGLVRFAEMLELAGRLGAARLATGHYARVGHDREGPLLRAAADGAKDQTYMLARLAPGDLDRLHFPLGDLVKAEVRAIARAAAIPVADRAESQDLCFLAGTDGAAFQRRHGSAGVDAGEIVDGSGAVLGHHAGQHLFTVGQRRGLGVPAREPLYVLRKEPRNGRVVVGPRSALATDWVEVGPARLERDADEVDRVKLRYRAAPVPCRLEGTAGRGRHERVVVRLGRAVDGVAPGQTACFLSGDRVVGFGMICGADTGVLRGDVHAA